MPYKITHDKECCTGCGTCVALCPENWEMQEGKAKPKKTEIEDIGCNQQAAESCPNSCITIEKV